MINKGNKELKGGHPVKKWRLLPWNMMGKKDSVTNACQHLTANTRNKLIIGEGFYKTSGTYVSSQVRVHALSFHFRVLHM